MVGQAVSHYKVFERIGCGGMGVVYRAEDLALGRRVALKFLPPDFATDASAIERFKLEARAAAALNHPNICSVYEIGEHEGQPFIAMELIEGRTLGEMIGTEPEDPEASSDRSAMSGLGLPPEVASLVEGFKSPAATGTPRPIPLPQALDIGVQVADALAAAHSAGVIHRDIKPANIFVGTRDEVKILDFGLAKLTEEDAREGSDATRDRRFSLTRAGSIVGTIAYMSPEQALGEDLDHRTDLFSLGAVLYEMGTARRAFDGRTEAAVFDAIIHKEPDAESGPGGIVSGEFGRIVSKALEKDRHRRYQNASELRDELARLRDEVSGVGTLHPVSAAPEGRRSLAVLPFRNLSSDLSNDYFGDGLAEELINALAQLEGLQVASRTSAFQFKDRDEDVRSIGRALNVDTVLEGSVRKAGDRIRVSAQLIDVDNGYHLWSERYDRRMEDIFDLQDDITQKIVDKLRLKLSIASEDFCVKRHTENVDAYNLYLKGRFHLNQRTEDGILGAIDCFRQASEVDAGYALPHAGLAEAYILLNLDCPQLFCDRNPTDIVRKAKEAARAAIDLDPSSAEAHVASALVYYRLDWNWKEAEEEFRLALGLQEAPATAHHHYAMFLASVMRTDEAIEHIRHAQELDPVSPIIGTATGRILHFARRYDEAEAQFKRTLELSPWFSGAHFDLGLTYLVQRRYREAIQEFTRLHEMTGSGVRGLMELAWTQGVMGEKARATETLEKLKRLVDTDDLPRVPTALFHVAVGEYDRAFELLDQGLEQRDSNLVYLLCEPNFDPLRSDPRFNRLLEKMRLTPV